MKRLKKLITWPSRYLTYKRLERERMSRRWQRDFEDHLEKENPNLKKETEELIRQNRFNLDEWFTEFLNENDAEKRMAHVNYIKDCMMHREIEIVSWLLVVNHQRGNAYVDEIEAILNFSHTVRHVFWEIFSITPQPRLLADLIQRGTAKEAIESLWLYLPNPDNAISIFGPICKFPFHHSDIDADWIKRYKECVALLLDTGNMEQFDPDKHHYFDPFFIKAISEWKAKKKAEETKAMLRQEIKPKTRTRRRVM